MARRSGALTAVAVVLSVVFVALAGTLFWFVASQASHPAAPVEPQEQGLSPKEFADYSWDELARVAHEIAAVATDEEAASVAERYNVSVGATRSVTLADRTGASATVVGIRHDGGSGITFMLSPLAVRAVNASGGVEGGWEACELRAWLAGEGLSLLPADLSDNILAVGKSTNNTGITADAASVTVTEDKLWLFSASEVCGPLTWFTDEYGDEPTAYTYYTDFKPYDELVSSEGAQYAYFRQAGVTGSSDPNHVLAMTYGGRQVAWWYRTAYPYSFAGEDATYFYQVMGSGFPSSVGRSDEPAGVVAGFCL